MYRRLQEFVGKNYDATYSAKVKMTFGTFVEKDRKEKKVKLPTAGAKNVFLVGKERLTEGKYAIDMQRSDYDELFETIDVDEMVVLETLVKGEQYAVDQIVETGLQANDKLKVNAQGKLEKDATGADAIAVYVGEYMDAGHKLHAIEIL